MPSPAKSGPGKAKFMFSNNVSNLGNDVLSKLDSNVTAPRNPKLLFTTEMPKVRVSDGLFYKCKCGLCLINMFKGNL